MSKLRGQVKGAIISPKAVTAGHVGIRCRGGPAKRAGQSATAAMAGWAFCISG